MVLLVGMLVVPAVPATRAYGALCAGPVDVYPVLAAARNEARTAATVAAGQRPSALTAMKARTLEALLRVKQSDYVAFPAHAIAGVALELSGCPVAATGDQWRKAALHSWADWPAQVAASGLRRTMGDPQGNGAVLEMLARAEAEQPWFVANVRRVRKAY